MDTQESYPPLHSHQGSTNILALIRNIALHRRRMEGLEWVSCIMWWWCVHLIVFTLFVPEIDEAFSQRKSKKVSVASPQTFLICEQTSADIVLYDMKYEVNLSIENQ